MIAYRKFTDAVVTHTLRLPDGAGMAPAGQELATLPDGRTVVVLFDGYSLPTSQPEEIAASIEYLPVPLPDDLRDAIKVASPHVELINSRVQAAISERYKVSDEIKLLRLAPSPETTTYNDYVEVCRAWGRAEKAKLGV